MQGWRPHAPLLSTRCRLAQAHATRCIKGRRGCAAGGARTVAAQVAGHVAAQVALPQVVRHALAAEDRQAADCGVGWGGVVVGGGSQRALHRCVWPRCRQNSSAKHWASLAHGAIQLATTVHRWAQPQHPGWSARSQPGPAQVAFVRSVFQCRLYCCCRSSILAYLRLAGGRREPPALGQPPACTSCDGHGQLPCRGSQCRSAGIRPGRRAPTSVPCS